MNTSVPVLDQPVFIKRIEVRRLLLPLTEPLKSSHGLVSDRDIVVVRIDTDDGAGWGECSALPEPTYTDEFAAGAFAVISEELAPRLVRRNLSVADLRSKTSLFPGNPMAKASLEMALLDVVLTSRSIALAEWLQSSRDRLPAGATVGVSSPKQLAERVQALIDRGYRRIKVKIGASTEFDAVVELTKAHPDVGFQIDPNGSCKPDDIDRLVGLSTPLDAIEQPFAADQIEIARQLVAQVDIPIIADEPIDSIDSAERLVAAKACSALAVKPPRLGGILSAVELHRAASEWGVALSIGGMIECGLGRHSLAAVASLDGFSVAGDLSPARRWIETDPWPDIEMETIDGVAHVTVPTGHGVAPPPDLEILKLVTTGTALVT